MRNALTAGFAAALYAALCSAQAAPTAEFTALVQGEKIGFMTVTEDGGGGLGVKYHYRVNGRGPDLDETWSEGPDGIPRRYTSRGSSTFGAPIADEFVLEAGRATWKSIAESGTKPVQAPGYYVPVEGSPALFARMVALALRQPGGRLDVLPEGRITVQKVLDKEIASAAGHRRVGLYAVTGLDIEPGYVWLGADGGTDFFAILVPGWFDLVPAGYEDAVAALEAGQIEGVGRQIEALARQLTHRYAEPILIRNARVFDPVAGRLGAPQDVYVNRGRIAALYPAGSPARSAGTIFDAAGRALLPGLVDSHDHESPWNAVQQLAGGITTARDMGNDNAVLADLSRRIEDGRALGARIVATGFIEGASPYASLGGIVVSSQEEALRAVDWYAERGYPQIKIYNSFKPEWVRATTDYAHARGMRVSGHIPAFMRAQEAIEQGYDEVQHVNQLLLNFFVTPTTDTRTLERFRLVAENTKSLDLDSAPVKDFIALLARRQISIDPTVAIFETAFTQKQGEMNPALLPVQSHYPVNYRRGNLTNSTDINEGNVDGYRASFVRMLEFIGRCHQAGVPIIAGTDGPAGWTLHRELELYVKAGMTPAEALRTATWNGAKYAGVLDRLGSIERGKLADLILVDGDPTTDISAIRRVALTMKEGAVFYPAEIQAATGIAPIAPAVLPLH